jgi:crossover junction endodeoxyribonuclease RuvC
VPEKAVIMGVDAALYATGVGIIKVRGDDLEVVHTELVRTSEKEKLPQRLEKIYTSICKLIEEYKPDILALEDIFYSKNLKIALSLGQARGVIMLACSRYGIELAEYSAREIKQAITGNGGASKEQVAYMVKGLLNIDTEFKTLDISDSLAAAICAGFKLNSVVSK